MDKISWENSENYAENQLLDYIKKRKLGFPYKTYSIKKEDLIQRFENLKTYKFTVEEEDYFLRNTPYAGDYGLFFVGCNPKNLSISNEKLLIKEDLDYYEKYNNISDYFNDRCRMKAKRKDCPISPYDLWYENYQEVIEKAKSLHGKVNAYTLRETIWSYGYEATQFRPSIITGFIKAYNSKRVLDFSSGWGDRLVGALAAGVAYCGCDPNTELHSGYKRIIEFFRPQVTDFKYENYQLINKPFEEADLDRMFDLVLTSPPYFDLEHYSQDSSQSILRYQRMDDWFHKFLMHSIRKCWQKLLPNGRICVVIDNIRNEKDYVLRMVREINKFDDSLYEGVISYVECRMGTKAKSPKPIWIWKKIINIQKNFFTSYEIDSCCFIYSQLLESKLIFLIESLKKYTLNSLIVIETNNENGILIALLSIACKIALQRLHIYVGNNISKFKLSPIICTAIMFGAEVKSHQQKFSFTKKNIPYIDFNIKNEIIMKEDFESLVESRLKENERMRRCDNLTIIETTKLLNIPKQGELSFDSLNVNGVKAILNHYKINLNIDNIEKQNDKNPEVEFLNSLTGTILKQSVSINVNTNDKKHSLNSDNSETEDRRPKKMHVDSTNNAKCE